MPFKKGDVVLVLYPHSDLKTAKRRPALVVQSETTDLPQTIVAMITSNLKRVGPTRIPVSRQSPQGGSMGLLSDSVIVVDNLATVLDKEIDRNLGHCPDLKKVDQALRIVLGL